MFLSLFFPRKCLACRRAMPAGEMQIICFDCASTIRAVGEPWCPCCGTPFQSKEGVSHLCAACAAKGPPFAFGRSLFYFEGAILKMIHQWKYHHRERIGHYFASRLTASRLMASFDPSGIDLISAVPLTKKRLRERGYNQSYCLARSLGKLWNKKVETFLLERRPGFDPSQTGLNREERLQNVKGVFTVPRRSGEKIVGKSILLVDDVFTTGATLAEASRVLIKTGANRVCFVTLARTP